MEFLLLVIPGHMYVWGRIQYNITSKLSSSLGGLCAAHISVLGSNSVIAWFLGRAEGHLGCWAWVKFT